MGVIEGGAAGAEVFSGGPTGARGLLASVVVILLMHTGGARRSFLMLAFPHIYIAVDPVPRET